jgi:TP901 family phage tail tape measure protein
VFFFRQGRTVSEAMELTKVAAVAARVASIDAVKSANFLTSAINGFGMAANQAMAVSDRFAALGASSASSYEEMAIALSKVAPVAKVAGVQIDFMMAVLAKGIETTREAPENIGTAFKTIFARMTQIRDFGTTLEDGMGVNTVERALKLAGVQLRDSSGNFRNMEQVLIELGYAFDGLDRNTQSYIATALAGTRQQSRLLAVMQNFGRTMELVDVSLNSSGATLAQHEIYSSGLEASMLRLQNAFQGVTLAFSNSEFVIKFIDRLAKVLGEVAENIKNNEKAFKIFASITVPLIVIALGAIKIAALQAAGALTAATFGLNIILPAVIALVGVGLHKYFQATKTEAQKLAEASKEVSEEIKKTQVAMYNLEKSKTQISTLVKRFKELDAQVIKTAEELAEMDDITQRIKEIGKTEYNIILTGKIDEDGREILKIINEGLKKAETQELELGRDKLKQFALGATDELDASDMQAAARALSEIMFGKSFLEASVDEQKQMQEIALNNFDDYVKAYMDIILEKEKADDRYVRSTNAISQAESMYASSVKPDAFQYIGNFFGNIGRGIGRIFGGDKQHITPAQLQEQMQEAGKVINDDNLSKLRTTGASGGLRNLFASNNAMLEAAAAAQNVTIDEILTKDMDFVIEGIQKHAQVVQGAFEAEIEKINANAPEKLDTKIIGMRESFIKLFEGKIDAEKQKELLDQFFGLDKNSQKALADSVGDLGFVYQLGIENLKEVISNTMTSTGGALVTASQKINIVSILRSAGLNEMGITSFFKNTSEFTADSIASFLNSIKSSFDKGVKDVDFQNLAQDLYGVLSGGMDSQKLYQTVQRHKSSASLILDLQEKFRNNILTAEEYQMVSEKLAGTGMMEEFMNGTLTAVKYMEESVNILTNSIDRTIEGVKGKMKNAAEAGQDITSFQEELLLLNHMRDNIEQLIFTQTMDDYYQSQIDYIQQINKELQEEIDLEQRKIDMNRSMLSLNRQIMALERDTSYGAQARREELQFTVDKQVAEQNKFIIETISNQKISELQSQMSAQMASFAQRTALSTEGIYSYLTTGTTSAKTFTTYSGVGVKDNKFVTIDTN